MQNIVNYDFSSKTKAVARILLLTQLSLPLFMAFPSLSHANALSENMLETLVGMQSVSVNTTKSEAHSTAVSTITSNVNNANFSTGQVLDTVSGIQALMGEPADIMTPQVWDNGSSDEMSTTIQGIDAFVIKPRMLDKKETVKVEAKKPSKVKKSRIKKSNTKKVKPKKTMPVNAE
ncbi:MAG: hypothetical protein XXXJIFNMEKO3_03372 [Candidatus Erwinia impunctatus]|nr:hypothetical protein XXXJIFNMEKO_03372 [Culicoides impunctatus]